MTEPREHRKVVVVGAGPAGAMAARELARDGLEVLLVDKSRFPRGKVCGCCLNAQALAALDAAGLGPLAERLGAVPLETAHIAAAGRHLELPLPGGVALSREALDLALIREAEAAGATFRSQTSARSLGCNADARHLALRGPAGRERVDASLVVLAAGLGGGGFSAETTPRVSPRARIGAGVTLAEDAPGYERGTVSLACGKQGYVGLVRVEDGRLVAACALDPGAARGGIGPAAAEIVAAAGLAPVAGLARARWRGTPLLTRRAAHLGAERLLAIGDAASFVEPFTGQGMAWALLSARLAAPLVREAVRSWRAELVGTWERVYTQGVMRRQGDCRALATLLRHPRLASWTVGLCTRLPRLAAPVLRRMNEPASARAPEDPVRRPA